MMSYHVTVLVSSQDFPNFSSSAGLSEAARVSEGDAGEGNAVSLMVRADLATLGRAWDRTSSLKP